MELNAGIIIASSNDPSTAMLESDGAKRTHRYKECGVQRMWNSCVF